MCKNNIIQKRHMIGLTTILVLFLGLHICADEAQAQNNCDDILRENMSNSKDPYQLAKASFNLGYSLYVRQKYVEANTCFQYAIQHANRMKGNESALKMASVIRMQSIYYLARTLHKVEGPEKATSTYNWLLREYPDHFDGFHFRGHVYLETGKPEPASADFSKAIEIRTADKARVDHPSREADKINSELSELFMDRSHARFDLKQYDQSLADASKAMELGTTSARAYYRRGAANAALGRPDIALLDFDKAIRLSPKYAEAYVERGAIYAEKKQTTEALKDFSAAIEYAPNWNMGYWKRGTLRLHQRDFEAAAKDFSKVIEILPKWPGAFGTRGNANFFQSKFAEAASDLATYFELGGTEVAYYSLLGISQHETGKHELAISNLGKAIKENPKDADLYRLRGISFFKLQKMDLSITDLTNSITLDSKPTDSLYFRAKIYFIQDKLPQALADINKALTFEPSAAHFEIRAAIHCAAGRKPLAKTDERKIIALGGKVAEPCQ